MNQADILKALFSKFSGQQGFMNQAQRFGQTLNGDPEQIVRDKLNRGEITPEQFEQARAIANMITGMNL